jgi:hypothetical protein
MMNLEGWAWDNDNLIQWIFFLIHLKYVINYPENFPKGTVETMKPFSHNSWSPGRGFNLWPPKHKAGLPDGKLLGSTCSQDSGAAPQ